MRMLVFLMAVIFATSLSFFSSADGVRGLSLAKPQAQEEAANARCAKRIAIGNEKACLMQKRKGRA